MKSWGILVSILLLAAACGGDHESDNVTVQETQFPIQPPDSLTGEAKAALDEAIQGEYENEETYRQIVRDLGEVRPFSAIVNAEVQHSDALAVLYQTRRLTVPRSQFNSGNVLRFDTLQEACAGGVEREQQTVARYNTWLNTVALPEDVRRVFGNLRDAAQNKHLPAFERCD